MADRFDEMAQDIVLKLDADYTWDYQGLGAAVATTLRAEREAGFAAGQKRGLERAAGAVGPQDKMPCTCISQKNGRWRQACDCEPRCNSAWAQEWCTQMNAADIARSLPLTPEKES